SGDFADSAIGDVVLEARTLVPCSIAQFFLNFSRDLRRAPSLLFQGLRVALDPAIALLNRLVRLAAAARNSKRRQRLRKSPNKIQTDLKLFGRRGDLQIERNISFRQSVVRAVFEAVDEFAVFVEKPLQLGPPNGTHPRS